MISLTKVLIIYIQLKLIIKRIQNSFRKYIYNDNKYNFKLKENTIKNIIRRWQRNSLRFTKYNAIEHKYNKNDELILLEYNNSAIYTSDKKYPISSEYFLWSYGQIIPDDVNEKNY